MAALLAGAARAVRGAALAVRGAALVVRVPWGPMGRLSTGLSTSRLANVAARAIAEAFVRYREEFDRITRRARLRFERRDWQGAVADAVERLELYGAVIDEIERDVRRALGGRIGDRLLWSGMKAVYSGLIEGWQDRELAETFFNSVTRRVFATVGVDPDIEFVDADFEVPPPGRGEGVWRTYRWSGHPEGLVLGVLLDAWPRGRFEDAVRDAAFVAGRVVRHLRRLGGSAEAVERAEVLAAPFFRRKGAYLVGRLLTPGRPVPFVLALLNGPRGIVVDALLMDEDDVSILFSFTRSHFHVEVGPPHEVVRFLSSLMPKKRVAELYISIGFHKHGKTELYRDLLHHLRSTDERFELARGTPGLVMVVFTMPGYDVVFKVIRDRVPGTKTVTRGEVMRKYRLVFRHDRAGRLVEAQEFEHLRFDRHRFAPQLLEELRREAGRTVAEDGGAVVVHHAYVERRVTPLDLYLQGASPEAARKAVVDFGQAIKDLATTNIFPGDLLPRNFGLTRHGRVVCYDYDELSLLTEFNFRAMPVPGTADEDLADEAWYGVGPRDVFPEEFPRFVALPPPLLEVLREAHGELFEPAYWLEMQARVRSGEIMDIFPYHPTRRLRGGP